MTHEQLVARAVAWLRNARRCRVVVWERNTNCWEQPDALGWNAQGDSTLVECKASRADFFRDAAKPFRKNPTLGVGSYRFYMVASGLVAPNEVPDGWGLLECHGRAVRVAKAAAHHPVRAMLTEVKYLVRHGQPADFGVDKRCNYGSHI